MARVDAISTSSPMIEVATNVPSTTARTTQPSRVTRAAVVIPTARASRAGHRNLFHNKPGAAPRHGVTGPKPMTNRSRKLSGTARRLKNGSPTPTWVPVNASTNRGYVVPIKTTNPKTASKRLLIRNSPSLDTKFSMRGEEATRCALIVKRANDPTSTRTRKPSRAGPIADWVKE